MTKQDVIKKVKESMGGSLTQEQIGKVLDATFSTIRDLEQDQSCRIKDFGTFKVKERAARAGVKLGTKEAIQIPARLAMTFKMSSSFKKDLNDLPDSMFKKDSKKGAKKAPKKAAAKKAPAKKAVAKKAPAKKAAAKKAPAKKKK